MEGATQEPEASEGNFNPFRPLTRKQKQKHNLPIHLFWICTAFCSSQEGWYAVLNTVNSHLP